MKVADRLNQLGLNWGEWEGETEEGSGFKLAENEWLVTRPYYDNVLYGSTTFCLCFADVVMTYPLTEEVFDEGTELWVFSIPEHIYKSAKPHLKGGGSKYLCLPVNKDKSFASFDYNPIPLDRPNDAKKYLKVWK